MMKKLLLAGFILATAWLVLTPAGTAKEDTETLKFTSFLPEYYRWYYVMIHGEQFGDPPELTDDQFLALEARVRNTSWAWALAMNETLVLRRTEPKTFTFTYSDIEELDRAVEFVDVRPHGPTVIRTGTWERNGSDLMLKVLQVNGEALDEPIDWPMQWIGNQIVIPLWRLDGRHYVHSVLRLAGDPSRDEVAPQAADLQLRDVENALREALRELARLRRTLSREEPSPRSPMQGVSYWVAVLEDTDRHSEWMAAVGELSRLGARETAPHLIRILREGDQAAEDARLLAIIVLAEWESLRAVPTLIELVDDPNPMVRTAAEAALSRITGRLSEPEGSASHKQRDWHLWWKASREQLRSEEQSTPR